MNSAQQNKTNNHPIARLVVLISGRGSNLKAIYESTQTGLLHQRATVAAVIADRQGAAGLAWARQTGLTVHCIEFKNFSDRRAFDQSLISATDRYDPDLVILAGFMRILSEPFVKHFEGRLLNIHPSLLPAFPGLKTHERALKAGVTEHGATVHWVNAELDAGQIIRQARVPVLSHDTVDSLAERVLQAEHQLYPRAILDVLDQA